jgi:hypothetical protein
MRAWWTRLQMKIVRQWMCTVKRWHWEESRPALTRYELAVVIIETIFIAVVAATLMRYSLANFIDSWFVDSEFCDPRITLRSQRSTTWNQKGPLLHVLSSWIWSRCRTGQKSHVVASPSCWVMYGFIPSDARLWYCLRYLIQACRGIPLVLHTPHYVSLHHRIKIIVFRSMRTARCFLAGMISSLSNGDTHGLLSFLLWHACGPVNLL